jgi:ADP-sugar diphosphatase
MTNGHQIKVTAEPGVPLFEALRSSQFLDWLARVDATRFKVREVVFQSLDMFGPTKIGFVKFSANVVDNAGKWVPGIVFASGGAVAVLPVLRCNKKRYAILAVQPRVATGQFDFVEIPAGMLDGSGDFAGAMAKEIKQEIGITISAAELVDLGAFGTPTNSIYTSPGRCDETLRFYCFEKDVLPEELESFKGRLTGEIEAGEQITLKVVPLAELAKIPDAKTIVAYSLYKELLAKRARTKRANAGAAARRTVAA